MLWIALNLPQLPLDIVLRSQSRPDEQPAPPLAVTHKKRVGWCNPQALEAGICVGMSESNAWSMAADLQTHVRDASQEQQALHESALWMLHFTPHVALRTLPQAMHGLGSRGLLAEVEPSIGLFGGLKPLQARMARGIAEMGLQGCWAVAPTATAAWLLAQAAPLTKIDATRISIKNTCRSHVEAAYLLDALPVSVLDTATQYLSTFNDIGCATLGDLRRLPREGVARRFGQALLNEIDRAYGNQAEAHEWFEAPERIDLKLELPAKVDTTQALLFASRRLLLQLTGWLTARHAATKAVTLWLHHEPARLRKKKPFDAHDYRSSVTVTLAEPSRDADHLGLLLRERLGQTILVAPVVEIMLVADQIIDQAAPNTELFPTVASNKKNMMQLIEHLQSRLGTQAVRLLAANADHRPEKSYTCSALQQQRTVCNKRTAPQPIILMRPSWLLPQPIALLTRQHEPFYQSPLRLLAGPNRIETGWWDDALALRDYFIAENEQHLLLWIFRLRPDSQGSKEGWFLHGFFA